MLLIINPLISTLQRRLFTQGRYDIETLRFEKVAMSGATFIIITKTENGSYAYNHGIFPTG